MQFILTRSAKPHSSLTWAIAWTLAVMGILAPLCLRFLVTVTIMKGTSMNPQYDHRDLVMEWHRAWWSAPIERGDVVTFTVSDGLYAKRVIGLPGEVVTLSGGAVFTEKAIQSPVRLEESYLLSDMQNRTFKNTNNEDPTPVRYEVPTGHVFVLADDRQKGSDSRSFVQDHRMPTPYVPLSTIKSTLGRRLCSFDR